MSKQYLDKDGLQVVANKVNEKLKMVSSMPQNADNGSVLIYTGENSNKYKNGHIYKYGLSGETYYAWTVDEWILYTKIESGTPEELYYIENDEMHIISHDNFYSVEINGDTLSIVWNQGEQPEEWTRDNTKDIIPEMSWNDITGGIIPVTSLPQDGIERNVLYLGTTANNLEFGHIYHFDAPKNITLNITTSPNASYEFQDYGFFTSNVLDDLPETSYGWTLNSVSDVDLLKECIDNERIARVTVGNAVCCVKRTTNPMIIGSSFYAVVTYYTDGTHVQETKDFTLTFGEGEWIDVTQHAIDVALLDVHVDLDSKAETFQFDTLPEPGVSNEDNVYQLTTTGAFYKCEPVGQGELITTANQLQHYVQEYGSQVQVILEPEAYQGKAMLIDGYEYFYNAFFSRFQRFETEEFVSAIQALNGRDVTDEIAASLGITYYPEGYEWVQLGSEDAEARETAAGAMALAQQAMDNVGPTNYSTTEQFTGKYWIDGKKIYTKVISCGALPDSTEKLISHNISNIDKMIYINGVSIWDKGSGTFSSMPINYINPTAIENSVGLYVNETDVSLRTTSNLSIYSETYIIVMYTKTTN